MANKNLNVNKNVNKNVNANKNYSCLDITKVLMGLTNRTHEFCDSIAACIKYILFG